MKDDLELVAEFQRGNQRAFDELVKRHMNKAMQLAYVVIGNYEDAKDVSQEAFVKAYRALGSFRAQSKFSTWFYRVLMNTAKDFLRQRNWKKFLRWDKSESMENFFESVEDARQSPARELLGAELDQKISRAVAKLPFKQQCVFTLRFIEGLPLKEIAEITGLAEGSVKATIHFAVQKFKQSLFPYLKEEVRHG
ncbi:MAG: sigma-70 family RNA polymerase sigma factor [Candidatus Omnitrophica bacterium]|nr:sigma-70 family RNA polymerase sigma factor [Candidatus Omnitrophota bacterium]